MSNNKKNTIAGQWDEYIAPFLQSLRVPQKGEPGYIPVTTSAQDIEQIEKAKNQSMMDSMQSQKSPELPIEQSKMNPVVENYIKSKINKAPVSIPKSENEEIQAPLVRKPDYMDKFNDEAYANAKQDSESRQDGLGWLQFAAGFGDALAQRSPMESAKNFDNIRARIKDETIGQFNRDKNQAVDDFKNKKMMDTFNPDSEQSIAFKKMIEAKFPDVARSYGKMWNQVSAADKDNIFEPLKLKENIEARKDSMRIAAMGRQDAMDYKRAEKAKVTDKQSGELMSHDKAIMAIDDVLAQKKNWDTGKLSMGMNKVASWVGLDDSKKSAFKADVGEQLAQYIKAISGATVSPTERASLLENVPSVYDNDETFEAKAKALRNRLQRNKDIELDYLQKSGKNVSEYGSPKQKEQSSFPRQVRKGNQMATVSNAEELKEAQDEGFQ